MFFSSMDPNDLSHIAHEIGRRQYPDRLFNERLTELAESAVSTYMQDEFIRARLVAIFVPFDTSTGKHSAEGEDSYITHSIPLAEIDPCPHAIYAMGVTTNHLLRPLGRGLVCTFLVSHTLSVDTEDRDLAPAEFFTHEDTLDSMTVTGQTLDNRMGWIIVPFDDDGDIIPSRQHKRLCHILDEDEQVEVAYLDLFRLGYLSALNT